MPCCPVCGRATPADRPDARFCSRQCWLDSDLSNVRQSDPSPELIRSRASRIRGEWSQAQLLERLRHDERPLAWELVCVRAPSFEE